MYKKRKTGRVNSSRPEEKQCDYGVFVHTLGEMKIKPGVGFWENSDLIFKNGFVWTFPSPRVILISNY